jgi:hypothetical protein
METRTVWPLTTQQFRNQYRCNYCLYLASYLGSPGRLHTLETHNQALYQYRGQSQI